jgi:hypothetical protein
MTLRFGDPENLGMHVLFPDAYKASARRAAIDLAGFALAITIAIVGLASFF